MGMDCYIWEAPNHRVFKDENWYTSGAVTERMYWRKNWDMVKNWSFLPWPYKNGEFVEIGSEELEEMIKVACTHRDYFGTYDSVPKLCELRDEVLGWEQNGVKDKKLFVEYDY